MAAPNVDYDGEPLVIPRVDHLPAGYRRDSAGRGGKVGVTTIADVEAEVEQHVIDYRRSRLKELIDSAGVGPLAIKYVPALRAAQYRTSFREGLRDWVLGRGRARVRCQKFAPSGAGARLYPGGRDVPTGPDADPDQEPRAPGRGGSQAR